MNFPAQLLPVSFSIGGIVIWASMAMGAPPASPRDVPLDVAIQQDQWFIGQIVDDRGNARSFSTVRLYQNGHLKGETVADELGRFAFRVVRGGAYLVVSPHAAKICRLWTFGSSPPAAVPSLLLVEAAQSIRGQTFASTSFYEWVEMHPVRGYTAITAAIVVPIVVIKEAMVKRRGS